MKRCIAFALVSLFLAGCGGGGGGTQSPVAVPVTNQSTQVQSGTIGLTFATAATTASKSRTPLFVSPNTTSAVIDVNNGPTSSYSVGPNSPYCTSAGSVLTCAIPFSAPVGTLDNVLVVLMGPLSITNPTLVALGQGSNSFPVTLGTPFTVPVGINPMVAQINSGNLTAPSTTAYSFGTASSAAGSVIFADASGANITGSGNVPNFAVPVSVVSSDSHFTISPAILTTPGQGFTIAYDGSTAVSQAPVLSLRVGTGPVMASKTFALPGLVAIRYNLSPNGISNHNPAQITIGPDGNVWWAEQSTNDLGKLDLTSHTTMAFNAGFGAGSPAGIATGGDGALYVSNGGQLIGRFSATTGLLMGGFITVGPAGTKAGRLATDADGNVWFANASTTAPGMGYIDKTTFTPTLYTGPTPGSMYVFSGITLGPDNAMYFLEAGSSPTTLARVTTPHNGTPGTFSHVQMPNSNGTSIFPFDVASGPDGNLWVSMFGSTATNQFYAVIPPGVTATPTEYPNSINPAAFANLVNMTKGPDGNMWIAEGGGAVRITPSTPSTSLTQFFTDDGGNTMVSCTGAASDGNMYCTAQGSTANPPFTATFDSIIAWKPR